MIHGGGRNNKTTTAHHGGCNWLKRAQRDREELRLKGGKRVICSPLFIFWID
jgi:hypothetical protein